MMPEGEHNFTYPFRLAEQPGGGPRREYSTDHRRFEGFLGRLECRLEVHSPLEVNSRSSNSDFSRAPVIPGSSLKGVIRSIAELVGRGCVSIRSERTPAPWTLCDGDRICPTCDLFGRLVRGSSVVSRGKVFISDASPERWNTHTVVQLYQGQPKEKHRAFYPTDDGNHCWRKLYHHHGRRSVSQPGGGPHKGKHANELHPVTAGSVFTFRVDFEDLDASEVALLAWAIELEPGLLHKMGRGKSFGLGSVKMRITQRSIQEARSRYTGGAPSNQWPDRVEAALAEIREDRGLDEIRHMLWWPPTPNALGNIKFPDHTWFKKNSQVPLRPVRAVVPQLPPQRSDPELPELERDLGATRSVESEHSVEVDRPDGFDETLWSRLPQLAREDVERIMALKSFKSEAGRFIERYRRDEHGEDHRRAIAQALWLKATSSERSWVREKIGDEHLPQEEKAPVGSVDEASPYDKAVAVLAEVSSVKKLNKKFFKQFKKLDDEELKTDLARKVSAWCEEHDCTAALEKMKNLTPYLD